MLANPLRWLNIGQLSLHKVSCQVFFCIRFLWNVRALLYCNNDFSCSFMVMFQYMVLVLVAFELLQLLTAGRFSCGFWSIMVLFQLFVCVFSLALHVTVVCFNCCVSCFLQFCMRWFGHDALDRNDCAFALRATFLSFMFFLLFFWRHFGHDVLNRLIF